MSGLSNAWLVRVLPGGVAPDKFVEAVRLPVLVPEVAIEESQVVVLELSEPLVPGDPLQRATPFIARETDADHPGIIVVAGPFDASRPAAPLLDPLADERMIGRALGAALCL